MKSNVLLVALSAAVLAACGAASGAGSDPTSLGLTSTNYVTVTQTPTTLIPTTLPGAGAGAAAGTVHPEEGSYVIASGDLPSTIAHTFKVKFTDLLNINGWTLVGSGSSAQVPEFPAVGTAIRIPPGWTTPGTTATVGTTATGTTATGTTPSTETTTTVAGGKSTCASGEYTIVAGDFPSKVAKALNTTVAALDAANAGTKGYKSFQVGIKIKTPPKANC